MRRGCLFFIVALLFSCSSALPKDVLPPKKMQTVLWDVLRADEMAGYYATQDTSLNKLSAHTGYYQHILELHHVTRESFKKSLQYYQNHPALFKVVLDSLQNYGERQQKKADSSTWSKPAGMETIRQNTPLSIDSLKNKARIAK